MLMVKLLVAFVAAGCSAAPTIEEVIAEANVYVDCNASWPPLVVVSGATPPVDCAKACKPPPPRNESHPYDCPSSGVNTFGDPDRLIEVQGYVGRCVGEEGIRSDGERDVVVRWNPCYCADRVRFAPDCG